MPPKKYLVDLTDDERAILERMIKTGKTSARTLNRAHVLLAAADGHLDAQIATALHLGVRTVERIRHRFAAGRLERALCDLPRPGGQRKLAGPQEAMLVALACSAAPEGRTTWTMQLLADKLIELNIVDTISDETVRTTLKKTL